MITPLIVTLLVSLGLSLVFTPIARLLAARINLMDRPDGHRKIHTQGVPVAGGLAILAAIGTTLLVLWCWPETGLGRSPGEGRLFLGLLIGCAGICVLGVVDDLGCLRGRHKLLGQLLIVLLVVFCGIEVHRIRFLEWEFDLGPLAYPVTVFLLLGAINSLNLLDGMDGLLSSVGVVIGLSLAVMAIATGHGTAAYVSLALVGALLGFLRYNFPPASIYLGDAGSMQVGLIVGVLAIQSSLKTPTTLALAVPLGLLTIPFFDTTAAILRRKLTGRSIYCTDRGHLHHCLLAQGWGPRHTLFLISLFCLFTAAGALASLVFNNEWLGVGCALAVVATLITTRLFGHAEMTLLLKRLVSLGSSLVQFPSREKARGYEVHLQGTINWDHLWLALCSCSQDLNLRALSLDINVPVLHENYYAQWNGPAGKSNETEDCWRLDVPLLIQGRICGRIHVAGCQDGRPVWHKIVLLATLGEDCEMQAHRLTDQVVNGVPRPVRAERDASACDQAAAVSVASPVSEV
jgi:UDP-GlcNAc:undecaprenyl-phosphate GlcNAc-1-phosphate transferase